jgi:hypothetical protein
MSNVPNGNHEAHEERNTKDTKRKRGGQVPTFNKCEVLFWNVILNSETPNFYTCIYPLNPMPYALCPDS